MEGSVHMLCASLMPRRLATAALLLASQAHAADPYPLIQERNVAVSMRDGVVLRADLYRPDAQGTFPMLLQRTPYDKNNGVASTGAIPLN
jgi:predicted acyl esterase